MYHFCHIQNLRSVLEHGLLSCNEQTNRGINHLSIAATKIQKRRSTMEVTCGPGGVVHDYVPFYLCKRSSMLMAVVQAKNVDQQMLVYFAVPIDVLARDDVVFTSASANTVDPPDFYFDPDRLVDLDWTSIDCLKWNMPTEDRKQARMAEVLVHKQVDLDLVDHIIVWNESFGQIVAKAYKDADRQLPPVRHGYDYRKHYYNRYPEAPDESLVTGPFFAKRAFDKGVEVLQGAIGNAPAPAHSCLSELRAALRGDLAATPLTAELVGLESDNPMHPEDAGKHTQQVVANLLSSKEFEALGRTDRLLTEIAAYFHDVGKGPKSRWAQNKGKQKVDPDHPIRAVPMVAEFLKEQVATMKPRSARVILMLVCYHDLVGDIIGTGRDFEARRDENQLYAVIIDQRDVDMLIAIGKADVTAVNPSWWNQSEACALRERAVKALQAKEKTKEA